MKLRHELNHMPQVGHEMNWAIRRALEPEGWVCEPKLGGYNSFWLCHPTDDRQFHFRWYGSTPKKVYVYDRYYQGAKIATLETTDDVLRLTVTILNRKASRKVKVTL
jgi:hypothetical protein